MRRVRTACGALLVALAIAVIALAILVTGGSTTTWGLLFLALVFGALGTWFLATASGSPPLRAGLRVASAAVILIGLVVSFYGGAVEGGQGWLLLVGILLVFAGIAAGARAGALGRRKYTRGPVQDGDGTTSGHGERWDRMKGGDC